MEKATPTTTVLITVLSPVTNAFKVNNNKNVVFIVYVFKGLVDLLYTPKLKQNHMRQETY